jgi:hypothetical protein
MAAMVEEGSLVEYLLLVSGRTPKRAKGPVRDEAVTAAGFGPLHRPGAWPAGTRPAGANTCDPDCGCALNKLPAREAS